MQTRRGLWTIMSGSQANEEYRGGHMIVHRVKACIGWMRMGSDFYHHMHMCGGRLASRKHHEEGTWHDTASVRVLLSSVVEEWVFDLYIPQHDV